MGKVTNCSIALYAMKSTRRNAKFTCRGWNIYAGYPNLKHQFTQDMDYSDMRDWLDRQPYSYYKLVVYKDNINLHNYNSTTFYTKEKALHVATVFAELLNASNIKKGY